MKQKKSKEEWVKTGISSLEEKKDDSQIVQETEAKLKKQNRTYSFILRTIKEK